ncbi:MAG: DUF4214 domain-containing protein [Pseudomonas sp.]|uniref:DUF4214 domain-containing protein n=1 Tax=Pseudomonas sp. TaxID=306 RepID=UPI003D6DC287
MPSPSQSYPYIDLSAPLNYSENANEDIDTYTAYIDISGNLAHYQWVMNQVGENVWTASLNSPSDPADVIQLSIPTGYAVDGYSLAITGSQVNQSAIFDFGSNNGNMFDDNRPLSSFSSPNVVGAGLYSITIGSGANVLEYTLQLNMIKVNEAPTTTEDALYPTFYTGGAAVDLFDNVVVSNEANQHITQFSLLVDGVAATDDEFLTIGGTDIHLSIDQSGNLGSSGVTFTTADSNGSILVSLTMPANTTAATVQTLLDGMTYKNTSVSPTLGERGISLVSISDDGGTAKTGQDTGVPYDYTSVTVAAPANAAPIVTTDSGSAAFIESGQGESVPVAIAPGIIVTDSDNSTLAKATVTISGNFVSNQDMLLFTSNSATTGDISASYAVSTGVLELSSGGGANLAQWQAALSSITYTNLSNNPDTGTRTITYVVNDGTSDSIAATRDVTVQATNNAPVVETTGGTTLFIEGNNVTSMPVIIDNGVTLSDADNATLSKVSVSITDNVNFSEDVLSFANNGTTMGNITATYNAGTGVMELTSLNATATLAQWQAALRSVTYTDTSENPDPATRTISFLANDGTTDSAVSSKSVSVISINDTPLATTSGGATEFIESATGTSLPVVVDSSITLTDVDNTTLASAEVSITNHFNSAQDSLSFTNDSATMGNISASYNASTGRMELTSASATATLAQWQAALRSVTYTDSSDNPDTSDRTITFTVNDGSINSIAAQKVVTVTATNDAPVVSTSGGTVAFTAGNNAAATPVVVDSGLAVSDPDSTTFASAKVAITVGFNAAEDVLAFENTSSMLFGNLSGNYDPTSGELTLISTSGVASLAQWQAALNAVTYTDTAITPDTTTRTISFTVNDGTYDSATVIKQVTVAALDNSPVLTVSPGDTSFTEGRNAPSIPVIVDSGVTVADLDSSGLASATVTISNPSAGDLLNLSSDPATIGDITSAYNPTTGTLTLASAGSATLAQWQAALRSVTYSTDSETPIDGPRTVSFVINDGTSSSAALTKTVVVASVNDKPDVSFAAATQNLRQDTALVFNSANHNLITVSDVDAGSSEVLVTLAAAHGLLTLGSTSEVVFAGDGTSLVTVTGTLTAINEALNGLKFTPTTGFTGSASIDVSINDQGESNGISDPQTADKSVAITVTAPPTTPVNPPVTVDGVPVTATQVTLPNGETGSSISVGLVTSSRQDSTGDASTADIDLVGSGSSASLIAKLPVGYGLSAVGGAIKTVGNSAETLKAAIDAATASTDQAHQNVNGQNFLDKLADGSSLLVHTITPVTASTAPTQPLQLDGAGSSQLTALVIDATQMNGKGSLALSNVDFAAIVGQTTVQGNTAGQTLTGDDANQSFIVNASNSFVFAGGGQDTLQITSFASANDTVLQGGQGNDTVQFSGDRSLYNVEQHGGFTIVSSKDDPNQQVKVVNVEGLSFADGAVSVPTDTQQTTLAALYEGLLGRQADVAGFDYWTQQPLSIGGIGLSILNSTEAGAKALNGDVSHDIAALYTAFFGRTVDTEGLAYWTEQVQQGQLNFVQVADSLLTSTEMTGHNKAPATWDFTV